MNIIHAYRLSRLIWRTQLNSSKILSINGCLTPIANNYHTSRHRFYHQSNDTRVMCAKMSGKLRDRLQTYPCLLSPLGSVPNGGLMAIRRMAGHNWPLTYDFCRERILLVLKLYDKIDPEKLTLDSHFYNDLGLDSLDHVEVIMAMEDEFNLEIPDMDADRLLTPASILKYITDKEEAYEALQHKHDDSHGHEPH